MQVIPLKLLDLCSNGLTVAGLENVIDEDYETKYAQSDRCVLWLIDSDMTSLVKVLHKAIMISAKYQLQEYRILVPKLSL